MSTRRQWILYSIARLALFGGVFAILMLLSVDLWISGIVAAIIALCVSYIFIRQPQRAARPEKPDVDAEAEDAAIDGAPARCRRQDTPREDAAGDGAPLERDRGSEPKPE